jgi:hypothetical protein
MNKEVKIFCIIAIALSIFYVTGTLFVIRDTERNKPSKKETTQVREFYDGRDNIGIIIEAYDGFVIKQISNFITNELIIINGKYLY